MDAICRVTTLSVFGRRRCRAARTTGDPDGRLYLEERGERMDNDLRSERRQFRRRQMDGMPLRRIWAGRAFKAAGREDQLVYGPIQQRRKSRAASVEDYLPIDCIGNKWQDSLER